VAFYDFRRNNQNLMLKNTRSFIFAIFMLISLFDVQAQKTDTLDLISPLDIPLYLAANFGELRPNHFHAGLDLKTQQVIGKNVYSIYDGYVSRIQLRPVGYGRAVYITHTNGYTSLYGHLHEFSPKIDSVIREYQHNNKKNNLDINFTPDQIPVKQGEVIAHSGNSGSSGGPHVHFEIRHSTTQSALNVLDFYPQITDKSSPKIYSLIAYSLDSLSFINNQEEKVKYSVKNKTLGNYSLSESVKASGLVGFSIRGYDFMHNVHNVFGYYSLELKCNDTVIYSRKIDSIKFSENYDINSLIDYDEYYSTRRYYEKMYVEENNALSIYNTINRGIVVNENSPQYSCVAIAKDFHGNSTRLNFNIEYKENTNQSINRVQALKNIKCNQDFVYNDSTFSVTIPKFSAFKDYSVKLIVDTVESGRYFSQKYTLISSEKVVKKPMQISIKSNLPDSLISKAMIQLQPEGKYARRLLTTINSDGVAYAESKIMGTFAVVIDTIRPKVYSLNFNEGENLSNENSIRFKMSDNFSGVTQYNAFVDGEWCILYFDAKRALVTLEFKHIQNFKLNSKHELHIILVDYAGNKTEKKVSFYK